MANCSLTSRLCPLCLAIAVGLSLGACGPIQVGFDNPPIEDRCGEFSGATALAGGRLRSGRAELTLRQIVLSAQPGAVGCFESSRAMLSAFVFMPSEVSASWDIQCPQGTGAVIEVQLVRRRLDDSSDRPVDIETPWLFVGAIGDREVPGERAFEGDGWRVDGASVRRAEACSTSGRVRIRWVGEGVRVQSVTLEPRVQGVEPGSAGP